MIKINCYKVNETGRKYKDDAEKFIGKSIDEKKINEILNNI